MLRDGQFDFVGVPGRLHALQPRGPLGGASDRVDQRTKSIASPTLVFWCHAARGVLLLLLLAQKRADGWWYRSYVAMKLPPGTDVFPLSVQL